MFYVVICNVKRKMCVCLDDIQCLPHRIINPYNDARVTLCVNLAAIEIACLFNLMYWRTTLLPKPVCRTRKEGLSTRIIELIPGETSASFVSSSLGSCLSLLFQLKIFLCCHRFLFFLPNMSYTVLYLTCLFFLKVLSLF